MNREIPTESEVLARLGVSLKLSPVTLTMRKIAAQSGDAKYDAILDAVWDDDSAIFALEYQRLGTPKEFANAVLQIQSWDLPNEIYPLLLLPYLKPEQLEELDRLGISGIDLCGNGVITIPGRLKVYRTGQSNRFRSSATIKNVYRGKTSLVARMFASRNSFESVQLLRDEIVKRDPLTENRLTKPIGLSTVSKALKTLEQDLIISREDDSNIAIRLLQRDRLMDQLLKNDEPLERRRQVKFKADASEESLNDWISARLETLDVPVVATGLASTSRYAVMQRGPVIQLYTTSISEVVEAFTIGGDSKEVDRFENIVLIESERVVDYFDARTNEPFPWASPLQTWLELMRGDKRDRETAKQIREVLLKLDEGE